MRIGKWMAAAGWLALLAQPAQGQAQQRTATAAIPADFVAQADALLAESFVADGPGAQAIVVARGKTIYRGGRGLADIDAKRPIGPDTVFRIGSISKQFTAALILQLAEEGKLSLSDPLPKFLPDFPKPGGDVTIRQLLSHTSGLRTFTPAMGSAKQGEPATTESLIAEFRNLPQQFPAGTQFSYNNSGYVLLGAIIEKVSRKPWYAVLTQRILRPLGLKTIRYGVDEPRIPTMARGYTQQGRAFLPARPIDMSVPHAAGALVGTAGDLAKWARALHGGKVVKRESYAQMIARTRLTSGEEVSYALGLGNGDLRGHRSIGHDGAIPGFVSASFYVPDGDLFVAVFTNSDAPRVSPSLTAMRLAALALGDPFPSFKPADMPAAEELRPLLGIYRGPRGEHRLLMRDSRLVLLSPNGGGPGADGVAAAGQGRFYYPGTLTWFTLAHDPAGKHVLTYYADGGPKSEQWVWSAPLPVEPVGIAVPREVLQHYVGEYVAGRLRVVVKMQGDGRLSWQYGAQAAATIVATSPTEFWLGGGVDARISFHEKDGRITHLTYDRAARKIDMPRVSEAPVP